MTVAVVVLTMADYSLMTVCRCSLSSRRARYLPNRTAEKYGDHEVMRLSVCDMIPTVLMHDRRRRSTYDGKLIMSRHQNGDERWWKARRLWGVGDRWGTENERRRVGK